jgi:hypothetical protein
MNFEKNENERQNKIQKMLGQIVSIFVSNGRQNCVFPKDPLNTKISRKFQEMKFIFFDRNARLKNYFWILLITWSSISRIKKK